MSFAVYVHWPFCKSKCPYCDFNSHVRDKIDGDAWKNALLREIDHYAELTPGKRVTSVFFGGGTPSLMDPSLAGSVLERIATRWAIADEPEITLEANPNSSEAAHFAAFKAAGINRLSIGVQALDDAALKFLGRGHDVREAQRAIDRAAALFERFSFDLIYARPGQTVTEWQEELKRALALQPPHLSLYQLTIEEGTQFQTLFARGQYKLPDEDVQEQLYDTTNAMLADAGLPAYEVSNYAKPGQESRHNLVYWRYEDYVGVGPGAHGRIAIDGKRHATRQAKAPETWLSDVAANGHATAESVPLEKATQVDEAVMMGFRLSEGIDAARFERVTGASLEGPEALDPKRVARMIADGFLARTPTGVAATPQGMKLLNALLAALRG
ncbi:MAG: radical SAM family heme chaperone HemW [Rhodospirillales bacterium]|jgi:putative oxygen-independent coproporphyrinogen III oxidase